MLTCEWMASDVKTHGGDVNWLHADSLDSIANIYSNAFTLIRNCRFPLYISADMVLERFDS